MKNKIILTVAVALMFTVKLSAQFVVTDPGNTLQSIINSTNQIVYSSQSSATLLKNFEETAKIYRQGREYYDKLQRVNTYVQSSRKAKECILLVGDITDIYVTNYQRMLADPNFSYEELQVIGYGYTQLMERGARSLAELGTIISPTSMSMTDKDRLDLIDGVYKDLTRTVRLTNYFTNKNIAVSLIRSREDNNSRKTMELYGTSKERNW